MNVVEHVSVCAAEEAGEVATAALAVQKALCKLLRFGPDSTNNGELPSNAESLAAELNDLQGAVEMLIEWGVELPGLGDREAIEAKKAKIRRHMNYALQCGTLQYGQSTKE